MYQAHESGVLGAYVPPRGEREGETTVAEIARVLPDEAIVRTSTVAGILGAVSGVVDVSTAYQAPTELSLLRLTVPPDDGEPSLVRRIRDAGFAADHNYVMAQMTHSQFQPISYYRPHPPVELPEAPTKADVRIVVIDTPVLQESPIAGLVETAELAKLNDDIKQDPLVFHGSFIAGVILQEEPRAVVEVVPAQDQRPDNFFTDWELACQITKIAQRTTDPADILSLSLGSSPLIAEQPIATAAALKQLPASVTVFAAAGNDGAELATYPAAYPNVLGVGGQPPAGEDKADFSNRGPHVDLWAPAVDRIGPFVDRVVGFKDPDAGHVHRHHVDDLPPSSRRPQTFTGWARGDGTSFATPYMAAKMATALIDEKANGTPDPVAKAKGKVIAEFSEHTNTNG